MYVCQTGQGRCMFVCNASEKCSHLVGGGVFEAERKR